MRSPLVAYAVLATLISLGAATAQAQSDARVVTVLALDADASLASLGERYYATLRTQVELHRTLLLNDVPEQRLDDLLAVMGCVELDADCSMMIRDVIGSDVIAFGEIRRVGDQTTLRLVLWDLVSGSELRSSAFSAPSNAALLADEATALSRSILYDAEASLSVDVLPVGADVWLDGQPVGASPIELTNLPLGPVEVRIEAEGYRARTETVVLDLGTTTVDWQLQGLRLSDMAPSGPSLSGRAAPWVLIGTGAALVASGVGVGVAERSTQDDFDVLVSGSTFDVAEANDLRDKGRRQAAVATTLLASGGVAIGTGALIAALRGGNESATAMEPRRWAITPSAGRRGAALDFELHF